MTPISPSTSVESLKSDGGGSIEQAYAECASLGSGGLESIVVTCPAGDEAAQGDFLHIVAPDGTKVAAWLDIDSDGTAPNGAIYGAADDAVSVAVALSGTPSTAAEVAAAMKTALEASDLADMTIVDNMDGTLTITSDLLGNVTDAVAYAEDEVAASSIAVEVTSGSAAASQDDYFLLRDDDTGLFHVWLNVNGEGTDPEPEGSTGIEVAVNAADSAAAIATAVAAAIDANAEFSASADGSRVKITTATKASVVDMTAGDSGISFSIPVQGYAQQRPSPDTSTASLTNF